MSAALESREIDLAIGILEATHRGIARERLFHERFVAITAPGWRPPAGRVGRTLTSRQLLASTLAVASPTATWHESVQRMLDRYGLGARVVVRTRHYASLPELVRATDLLAIVPRMYAAKVSAHGELRVWGLPDPRLDYDVSLLWHESATGDPAHAWLRALVRRLFGRSG